MPNGLCPDCGSLEFEWAGDVWVCTDCDWYTIDEDEDE